MMTHLPLQRLCFRCSGLVALHLRKHGTNRLSSVRAALMSKWAGAALRAQPQPKRGSQKRRAYQAALDLCKLNLLLRDPLGQLRDRFGICARPRTSAALASGGVGGVGARALSL